MEVSSKPSIAWHLLACWQQLVRREAWCRAAAGNEAAQLVCNNSTCRVVLMYPRGASQVQCSLCGTINCAMAVSPTHQTSAWLASCRRLET